MTEAAPGARQTSVVVLAAGMGSRFGGLKQLAPVGPHGETCLDYAAGCALAGGVDRVVLVVRPEIRDEIEAHIAVWPAWVAPILVEQPRRPTGTKPYGTALAVAAAQPVVDGPFVVANADDVYAGDAFARLVERLRSTDRHVVGGYRLADTLATPNSANRGLCTVRDSALVSIDEGRVDQTPDGLTWTPIHGGTPRRMTGDEPVSMNLLGFQHRFLDDLRAAGDTFVAGSPADDAELFLPAVLAQVLARAGEPAVDVVVPHGRSFGVTHREDLPIVQAAVARLCAEGALPDPLWA